jgi:hypothetical protein
MLEFDGSRTTSTDTRGFAFGFRDEGSFSALPPLCDHGSGGDVEQAVVNGLLTGLRRFECDGGSADVIARTWVLGGDPSWGYEEGAWQIVEGTGDFERLHGKGTYVRVLLSDGATSEVWRGLVDFDDVPPLLTLRGISIHKPRRPGGAYVVRISFKACDASGGPVSYLVTGRSSLLLAAKYGIAGSGTTSVVLGVHPRAAEHSVRVEIEAADQVGNERLIARTRPLVEL